MAGANWPDSAGKAKLSVIIFYSVQHAQLVVEAKQKRKYCSYAWPRYHSSSSPAPLHFAWDAIIVSIHFCIGTISYKISRFCTGCHLRAVRATIASELLI